MTYELWDTESRNVIGEYETKAKALAAVAEAIELNGERSAALFTLIGTDNDGAVKAIAGGWQFVTLARQQAMTRA